MEIYTGYYFSEITLNLSATAIQWLSGTTKDKDEKPFRNFDFFHCLLKEMRTENGKDYKYRRPIDLNPGEMQFSEIALAEKWNLGRKKLHNILLKMESLGLIEANYSRVGSTLTFQCVSNWREDRESKEQSLS